MAKLTKEQKIKKHMGTEKSKDTYIKKHISSY